MLRASRSRTAILLVLAAYFAAHTLGAFLHEQLHEHAVGTVCCHRHDGHGNDGHSHHGHGQRHDGPSQHDTDRTPSDGLNIAGSAMAHDHACVVCRLSGQPVVSTPSAAVELSAELCLTAIETHLTAPHTTSVRISRSRAPPAAA